MKLSFGILAIVLGSTLLLSCEEKTIPIPPLEIGERKVVVEELTGVTCQNCPDGATILQNLSQTLGDKLIIVALHTAQGYDVPFPDSKYDFRTADCDAIGDYLYTDQGDPGAPAATIDRQLLNGEEQLFIYRNAWQGAITKRLGEKPEVGVFLNHTYDASNRALTVNVNVSPDQLLEGKLKLTVLITEDSIVDKQKKGTETITNYVHRHVFRDAITAPLGDDITNEMSTGLPFVKSYALTLPSTWVDKHCSIVAFVHRDGDKSNREILQADEHHVKD